MITSIEDSPLFRIVNPRSIAFFGASNNFMRMGSIMLSSVEALGYEGAIYPIHPAEEEVRGYRAYESIQDLPEVPDLAILVLPTEVVCPAMEECGRKGVRNAIVVSGGFREANPEGAAMQKELERMQADFIANTTHELRTPLHSIRGFINLLLNGHVNDENTQHEILSIVDNESQHLNNLVDGILNISRIESGNDPLIL